VSHVPSEIILSRLAAKETLLSMLNVEPNISVETMIYILVDYLLSLKEQHLFEIEIFCNKYIYCHNLMHT